MPEWRTDIENAPYGERLLTYGQGGIVIKTLDELGNWRGSTGLPFGSPKKGGGHVATPTHWMLLPEAP